MNESLEHRLIGWILRRPLELVAGLYALALLWGGLMPFDFSGPRGVAAAPVLVGLPRGSIHLADALANIAAFVPFGLLACALLLRSRWGWFSAVVGSVLLAVGVSLGIETAQSFSPQRSSSLMDLGYNVAGAIAGAMLYALVVLLRAGETSPLPHPDVCRDGSVTHPAVTRWLQNVQERPVALLAQCWAGVIAIAALAPFDVAISVDRLVDTLRDVTWIPFARTARLGRSVWAADGSGGASHAGAWTELWQLRLDYAWAVFAYALLAVLVSRYLVRHCRVRGVRAALMTFASCGMLAAMVSLGQLVIMSHPADVTYVVFALIGTLGGVLSAEAAIRAWSPEMTNGGLFAPRSRARLVTWSIAGCLAYLAARALAPFEFDFSADSVTAQMRAAERLPLAMYQQARLPIAIDDLVHKSLPWAALATLVCIYRRHRGVSDQRQPIFSTAACAAAVVAVMEALQIFVPARTPAVTDVLLAFVAAALGVAAYRLAAVGATSIGLVRPIEAERMIYNVEFGSPDEGPRELIVHDAVTQIPR